jgi:ATP-dependent DNA helicase RecG
MSTLMEVSGIGPKMLDKLNHEGIHDIFQLFFYYPKRYQHLIVTSLSNLENQKGVLKGTVISEPTVAYIRRKLTKLTISVMIEGFAFSCTIFNREFLKKSLTIGTEVIVIGEVDLLKNRITATSIRLKRNFEEGILPIYGLETIPDKTFQTLTLNAYKLYGGSIIETLPIDLIKKYHLLSISQVILRSHRPRNEDDLIQVKRRLKYEELLVFQLVMRQQYLNYKIDTQSEKRYNIDRVKAQIKSLPFELTDDQKSVTNEIFRDLKSSYSMNRLLEGDVGSGKTIVSFISLYAVLTSGYQVAYMAPTEVLSNQVYLNLKSFIKDCEYPVYLLTSSTSKEEREKILEYLQSEQPLAIVGTHSLIQDTVTFSKLGLVITDEQHRFGVSQRSKLIEKGSHVDVLYMSATPIPRSLALSIYGELDVSILKDKPASRKDVITRLISPSEEDILSDKLLHELSDGHQVFIIAPLINDDEQERKDVLSLYKQYVKSFPNFKVGALHGKMKSEEKNNIMTQFYMNEINILVSTTVIEVGVDVPNATLMIIYEADRFGLSQLHQLRGRVGRSSLQSYLYLVSSSDSENNERLKILVDSNNGFEISMADLNMRGPGEFLGTSQSGSMGFKYVDFIKDIAIVKEAQKDAVDILENKLLEQKEYRYLRTVIDKKIKERYHS